MSHQVEDAEQELLVDLTRLNEVVYVHVFEAFRDHDVARIELEDYKPILAGHLLVYEANPNLSAFDIKLFKRKLDLKTLLAHQVVQFLLVRVIVDQELSLMVQIKVNQLSDIQIDREVSKDH